MSEFEKNSHASREACPCDAVRELKQIVDRHEHALAHGATSFALIKQDLEHIRKTLDKKDRFNINVLSSVVNILLTLLLGFLAARLGLNG